MVQIEKRISEVERKRDRLVEAYTDRQEISSDLYRRQMAKLDEERAMLALERQDAEGEQWDVDGLLGFAEHLVMNARRVGDEAGVEQKQRLQRFVVTAGLDWNGKGFGTVTTGWFYSQLQAESATERWLVELTGFEPVTS